MEALLQRVQLQPCRATRPCIIFGPRAMCLLGAQRDTDFTASSDACCAGHYGVSASRQLHQRGQGKVSLPFAGCLL